MNNKYLVAALITLVLIGGFFFISNNGEVSQESSDIMMKEESTSKDTETEKMMMESDVAEDKMMKETDSEMLDEMLSMEYMFEGDLEDVTEGPVDGFDTNGSAFGFAQANYDESGYKLLVTFDGLPELTSDFFYEGWVVRKDPFDVISTGPVDLTDDQYTNAYNSETDLSDHDFYVLTLEPDDGDPAPAAHIVEGTLLSN